MTTVPSSILPPIKKRMEPGVALKGHFVLLVCVFFGGSSLPRSKRKDAVQFGGVDNRQCLSWSLTPCPTRQAGASYRAVPAWVSLQCPFQCPLRLVKLARPLPLLGELPCNVPEPA